MLHLSLELISVGNRSVEGTSGKDGEDGLRGERPLLRDSLMLVGDGEEGRYRRHVLSGTLSLNGITRIGVGWKFAPTFL